MLGKVVTTNCGPVEYFEAGMGDPVLYFHGMGIAGDFMLTVEARMLEDGFRLIVPNRPGYGRTPLPADSYGPQCAATAGALLDTLGIDRVSVMGSSGGAAFAASFALTHPGRTNSLVLLCPQLHRWDDKRWLPKTSRWTLPLLKRPVLRRLLLKCYRYQLRRLTATQFLKTEAGDRFPDVVGEPVAHWLCEQTLAAMRQGTANAGFENDFVVFTNEEIIRPDSTMQTPTLIIYDEKDPLAPVDHVNWFASHCATCERVPVHAGGHLIWVGPGADVMHRTRVRFLRQYSRGLAGFQATITDPAAQHAAG